MAKISKDLYVLTVHVVISDGREIRKIEAALNKRGKIHNEFHSRTPDNMGRYQIKNSFYTVSTENPTSLKMSLRKLGVSSKITVL